MLLFYHPESKLKAFAFFEIFGIVFFPKSHHWELWSFGAGNMTFLKVPSLGHNSFQLSVFMLIAFSLKLLVSTQPALGASMLTRQDYTPATQEM